jgi:hypothetical protein
VAANKEALKKKRRLEVLGGSEDDQEFVRLFNLNGNRQPLMSKQMLKKRYLLSRI